MSRDANPSPAASSFPSGPVRLFLHEPGWQVALKVGSDRLFCYMTAPGKDFYHRINDGEIYLHRDEERLCVACAVRRGLLSHEPRLLPESYPMLNAAVGEGAYSYDPMGPEYDLIMDEDQAPER